MSCAYITKTVFVRPIPRELDDDRELFGRHPLGRQIQHVKVCFTRKPAAGFESLNTGKTKSGFTVLMSGAANARPCSIQIESPNRLIT